MVMSQARRLTLMVIVVSVCLFISSLFFDSYNTGKDNWASPIVNLLLGWMGIALGGWSCIAWYANPLIFMAWVVSRNNNRLGLLLASGAVFLSISFILFGNVLTDEAGHIQKVTGYGAGYWLWLGSMAVMAIGNALVLYKQKNNSN